MKQAEVFRVQMLHIVLSFLRSVYHSRRVEKA
nr:MAG TPA: hypothetical protein [Caudoviricetes sp.]